MKIINSLIIILATLLLAWGTPELYHMMTDDATDNIFTYYSSVEKSFCTIDFDEVKEELVRKNVKTGREYTETEFDSILPLFYYRQLLSDGRLPDTIAGTALSPRQIGMKTFFFRNDAKDKNKPHIPLYTLFESMSGRVNLEMPGDFFRISDKIEFINPETNTIKQGKSQKFMAVFERSGFRFPARLVAGNPSARKPYDEGYFISDSNDQIFHLKMVNGKPFLRNTGFPSDVKPAFIATYEPDDRSFYAFVFGENNKLYIITTEQYKVEEIPTPAFDVNTDRLLIMANPLYWNVNVISGRGKEIFALDAKTKEVVDQVSFIHKKKKDPVGSFLLPFEIRMEKPTSLFISPSVKLGTSSALLVNLLFTIVFYVFCRNQKRRQKPLSLICIFVTGIYGFIPCLVFARK